MVVSSIAYFTDDKLNACSDIYFAAFTEIWCLRQVGYLLQQTYRELLEQTN